MTFKRIDTLRAFFYSLAFHAGVIGLLMVSVEFDRYTAPISATPSKIVKAVAVDQQQVDAEIKRLRAAEHKERRELEERERKLKEELEKAKQARQAEEARLAKLKKEREEQERKKRAETQRLREAEAKRKQEEEKQRQVEQEQRKKAEAEAQRAEEERKRQEALRAQELLDAIAAEEQQIAASQQDEADQGIISQYAGQIKAKIQSVFINPLPNTKLSCVIHIRMIPGGEVVSAAIVRSSGNSAFDRQAEIAVEKASPLPVPSDPRLFQKMREIDLIFDLAK